MSPYQGLSFFLCLAVLLIPALCLGLAGKSLRVYGLAATGLMLLLIYDTAAARLLLLGFWLWQAGLSFGYLKLLQKGRAISLWVPVGLSLLPLLLVKLGGLLPPLRPLGFLGVSYMSFRAVQVLLDIGDGAIRELSLADYSYFLLFFPSLASGPIDRYRRFLGDVRKQRSREDYIPLARQGLWKLMTGAFYHFALGNLIWQYWVSALPDRGFWATWGYLYAYTFFMFFDFAGYSRMAIGTAYLLGIEQPENFRLPFLSVDMKDFWSRWHISLSTWLRDYVYTRFCMAALRGKWFKGKRTSSYLGYLITMTLMGLWHGFTPAYLVYGVYHGLLMAGNELLDTRFKGFRKLKKQPVPQALLVLLTFHLFGFGLLIFSGRIL